MSNGIQYCLPKLLQWCCSVIISRHFPEALYMTPWLHDHESIHRFRDMSNSGSSPDGPPEQIQVQHPLNYICAHTAPYRPNAHPLQSFITLVLHKAREKVKGEYCWKKIIQSIMQLPHALQFTFNGYFITDLVCHMVLLRNWFKVVLHSSAI